MGVQGSPGDVIFLKSDAHRAIRDLQEMEYKILNGDPVTLTLFPYFVL